MRMWMVNPKFLCRKHLLGEHNEIHKHKHNFEKKHKISGRIFPIVLIEPNNMESRHDELVEEMVSRGYNHQSPYSQPSLSHLVSEERYAKANLHYNIVDLCIRCADCRKNILGQ